MTAAHVDIIAVGKAAGSMLDTAATCLGRPWRSALGISTQPRNSFESLTTWHVTAHPVPDERSEAAGRAALALAQRMDPDDVLLVLLSGGASSLMAVPAPGLTLADKAAAQAVLLKEGADIQALNTVRKHLSAIKGGKLAAASAAKVVTLMVSDVIGNDISTIGSGPTAADPTTFAEALAVIERQQEQIANAVWRHVAPALPALLDAHSSTRDMEAVLDSLSQSIVESFSREVARHFGDYIVSCAEVRFEDVNGDMDYPRLHAELVKAIRDRILSLTARAAEQCRTSIKELTERAAHLHALLRTSETDLAGLSDRLRSEFD